MTETGKISQVEIKMDTYLDTWTVPEIAKWLEDNKPHDHDDKQYKVYGQVVAIFMQYDLAKRRNQTFNWHIRPSDLK